MNRTDRLLAIILELQAKRWQRAEDLAATFEVSKRTIYRDVQALSESGVPVVASPGQGYSLAEGYFLPPLRFTSDEALLLLLGGDFMRQNFDEQYQLAARSAVAKIAAVLTEGQRAEVNYLTNALRFMINIGRATSASTDLLPTLRRAIIQRRRAEIVYHTRYGGDPPASAPTERVIDPYGLVHIDRAWYLVAYCHLRRDKRHFRLDRVEALRLLNQTFERPADVELLGIADDTRPITIRAIFDRRIERWVREDPSYFAVSFGEHPDGLLVTLQVRHETDALNWLMSWGAQVRILEPESLRQRIADEARAMLENHDIPESLLT